MEHCCHGGYPCYCRPAWWGSIVSHGMFCFRFAASFAAADPVNGHAFVSGAGHCGWGVFHCMVCCACTACLAVAPCIAFRTTPCWYRPVWLGSAAALLWALGICCSSVRAPVTTPLSIQSPQKQKVQVCILSTSISGQCVAIEQAISCKAWLQSCLQVS